ncbi:MAG: hypothetical protein WAM60_19930 [Candidatus Promineifilaceae bacterium]
MKARVFIYLVVSIGLLITALDIENTGESAAPPKTANRQVYQVTIEGSVGNVPFSREGSLFLVSAKAGEQAQGLNRINFWLVSSDPRKRGEQGAIMLATSSQFYINDSQVDFASTHNLNFAIDAHFDEEVIPNPNAFSFNGLTFETLSKINVGDVHLDLLKGGEIAGTVVLTGINLETQQAVHYTAVLHGHYLGNQ